MVKDIIARLWKIRANKRICKHCIGDMQRYGKQHAPIACINPVCDGLRNQRGGSTRCCRTSRLIPVFEQEICKFSDFDYKNVRN